MIEVKSILREQDQCFLCKRPKQVALVRIDQSDVKLCQKHLWAMAEMKNQTKGKEVKDE
jgi:hypothetical protein